jgi:hypothetical protein
MNMHHPHVPRLWAVLCSALLVAAVLAVSGSEASAKAKSCHALRTRTILATRDVEIFYRSGTIDGHTERVLRTDRSSHAAR